MIGDYYFKLLDFPRFLCLVPAYKNIRGRGRKIFFGKKSYDYFIKRDGCSNKYGYESLVITIWREIVHCSSSILIFLSITLVKNNSLSLLYIFLLITFMFTKEFLVESRNYGQPYWKATLDFLSWTVPVIFLFSF